MEHAGDIQQLGVIDFADVEQKTNKHGETEELPQQSEVSSEFLI